MVSIVDLIIYIYIYIPPKNETCKSPAQIVVHGQAVRPKVLCENSFLGVPTFQIFELAEDVVGNCREGIGAQIQNQHCDRQDVHQGLANKSLVGDKKTGWSPRDTDSEPS